MASAPTIFGILNVTPDSFSDGGSFLEPAAATGHARRMLEGGADVVDIGAAASGPGAPLVEPETEIARLRPVLMALKGRLQRVSVDTSNPVVQRFCLTQGVAYLNDVRGFDDPGIYAQLAQSSVRLVVVHTLTGGRAASRPTESGEAMRSAHSFFRDRVMALERAGIARGRLILDPGMGLFLGVGAAPSLEVLRGINELRKTFELPVMVSVSRKSFLGALTGRGVMERGAASLAAELYAARQGVDCIRTHDPAALRDALTVMGRLDSTS